LRWPPGKHPLWRMCSELRVADLGLFALRAHRVFALRAHRVFALRAHRVRIPEPRPTASATWSHKRCWVPRGSHALRAVTSPGAFAHSGGPLPRGEDRRGGEGAFAFSHTTAQAVIGATRITRASRGDLTRCIRAFGWSSPAGRGPTRWGRGIRLLPHNRTSGHRCHAHHTRFAR
jgi:hypothetical protein